MVIPARHICVGFLLLHELRCHAIIVRFGFLTRLKDFGSKGINLIFDDFSLSFADLLLHISLNLLHHRLALLAMSLFFEIDWWLLFPKKCVVLLFLKLLISVILRQLGVTDVSSKKLRRHV